MKDYEYPEYDKPEEPGPLVKVAFSVMFGSVLAWIVFVLHFLPFSAFFRG